MFLLRREVSWAKDSHRRQGKGHTLCSFPISYFKMGVIALNSPLGRWQTRRPYFIICLAFVVTILCWQRPSYHGFYSVHVERTFLENAVALKWEKEREREESAQNEVSIPSLHARD